jgi:N-acetylglucosaminyl-diphospho-decaprenol L-rhamnosyltransferase
MFDENFFLYGEEEDLCKRVRDKGWEVHYYPEPQIVHYGGQSTKLVAEQARIESNVSKVRWMKKHRPKWEVLIFLLMWSVFLLIRVAFKVISGVFKKYYREVARAEWKSIGAIWKI